MKRHLTYANVMATVAVFATLGGGGAYAASKITSDQIAAGAVGTRAIEPRAVTSSRINDGAVSTRTLSGGVWKAIRGQSGTPGPQGAAGAAGARGETGPAGTAGAVGAPGAAGADGEKGDTGADGPKGATGDAGAPGTPGAQGTPGIPGSPGATGPTGPEGPQGVAGPAGGSLPARTQLTERSSGVGTIGSTSTNGGVAVQCATDERVVGGGFRINAPSTSTVVVTGSGPSGDRTWSVDARRVTGSDAFTLTATAICQKVTG